MTSDTPNAGSNAAPTAAPTAGSTAGSTAESSGTGPRIPAVEPPYPPDLAAMLEKWMPPNSGREPLALFRVLARHPELFARARPFGAGILGRGTVPPRLREVMILRTCALAGAEYEWGVHATAFGAAVGLSGAQVTSTARDSADDGGADDPVWDDTERAVFRLAGELHARADVSDALFAELSVHFSHEQMIELCLTAGWYHAIAYVINAARIPLEPWAERFPDAARSSAGGTSTAGRVGPARRSDPG